MKINFYLLLIVLVFSSCAESEKEYLDRVSRNLLEISSVQYDSKLTATAEGEVAFERSGSEAFDFQDDNPHEIKYHLYSKQAELIFNGADIYQSITAEEVITTSKNVDPENFNNPLYMSLSHVRNMLPKLIKDDRVTIGKRRDTVINSVAIYAYDISLEKAFVHPVSYDFVDADESSEYYLFVNKENDLPYRIEIPNSDGGSTMNTFTNIKLDVDFEPGLWKGETLPEGYLRITDEEYFNSRENNLMSHLGEPLAKWELPNLKDDTMVDLQSYRGKVLLLDFWFKGCYPCKMSIPSLNEINAKFANKDFKLFSVEYEERASREKLLAYVKENNVEYSGLYEGKKFAMSYGVTSGPTFMIVDKSGKIIHIKDGFTEENIRELEDIISKSL